MPRTVLFTIIFWLLVWIREERSFPLHQILRSSSTSTLPLQAKSIQASPCSSLFVYSSISPDKRLMVQGFVTSALDVIMYSTECITDIKYTYTSVAVWLPLYCSVFPSLTSPSRLSPLLHLPFCSWPSRMLSGSSEYISAGQVMFQSGAAIYPGSLTTSPCHRLLSQQVRITIWYVPLMFRNSFFYNLRDTNSSKVCC